MWLTIETKDARGVAFHRLPLHYLIRRRPGDWWWRYETTFTRGEPNVWFERSGRLYYSNDVGVSYAFTKQGAELTARFLGWWDQRVRLRSARLDN